MDGGLSKSELQLLIEKAYESRIKVVKMMRNGSVHVGGALSSIDILTLLYNKILNHNPKNLKWNERDRFILSAGHKAVALYAVLQDLGYFDESLLWTYHKLKSSLPEHPEVNVPGVEFPTGALGHGLAAGNGMAIAAKIDRKKYRVFVLLGDGECEEGTVWEAALAASKYKLDNLIAIVDKNGLQVNGPTKEIMDTDDLGEKFCAFGWAVKVVNGHDYRELYKCFSNIPFTKQRPSLIVAHSVKSKGIDFAENDFRSHHSHWDDDTILKALNSLEKRKSEEILKSVK
jgi:transketolase